MKITFDVVGSITMEFDKINNPNFATPERIKEGLESGSLCLNVSEGKIHILPSFGVIADDGHKEFDLEYSEFEIEE